MVINKNTYIGYTLPQHATEAGRCHKFFGSPSLDSQSAKDPYHRYHLGINLFRVIEYAQQMVLLRPKRSVRNGPHLLKEAKKILYLKE